MDLIITHSKCPDGFCAAFIAKKRYPEAEILALDHGDPIPFEKVRGKNVLVTDFSWPSREDNIKLHDSATSFHILDHHKTAAERLHGLPFVTFDMKRSGAGITWDYLFLHEAARPWYVNYVEDRDLWNWALPNSKAINAYIMSLPFAVEAWQILDRIKPEHAEQFGIAVLNHIDRYVREAAQEAQFGEWDICGRKRTVAVCNVPYMNCSEIGNVLAEQAEVSMTWFERSDGLIQFSLRSIGSIDVSLMAKTFLGGGHQNAAGFRLSVKDGRNLIDTILSRQDDGD